MDVELTPNQPTPHACKEKVINSIPCGRVVIWPNFRTLAGRGARHVTGKHRRHGRVKIHQKKVENAVQNGNLDRSLCSSRAENWNPTRQRKREEVEAINHTLSRRVEPQFDPSSPSWGVRLGAPAFRCVRRVQHANPAREPA